MQSYLVKYVDLLVSYNQAYEHMNETVDDILEFLEGDIIPHTSNYFDELIEIAILTKHIDNYPARGFRNALKFKILEQRDSDSAAILIRKFS